MQQIFLQVLELINSSADPALIADSDAKILWSNESAKRILSITSQDVELGDLFQPDAVRTILSSQSWCEIPIESLVNNNLPLKLSALSLSLMGPDPDDEYFLIIMRSLLIDQPAPTPVDDELSAIAHDLKNPLGAIFGYSDALIDTSVGSSLNPKQREIISRIRSTAARSLDLVRNIQHISLLKSATKSSVTGSCDLHVILRSVLDETWREDPEHPRIKLELTGEKLVVKIERLLLERVLSNLYANALKFTPSDGIITLRTKLENNSAVFEINNNLPIIPSTELMHIFDRHMRGTTSRGTSGSGLGLFIVFQILQRAGGTISVTSKEPEGTIFKVILP